SAIACLILIAEVISGLKTTVARPSCIFHMACETPFIFAAFSMRCLHMAQFPATSKVIVRSCCAKLTAYMLMKNNVISPLYIRFMFYLYLITVKEGCSHSYCFV